MICLPLSLSLSVFPIAMKQQKSVTQFCLDYIWSRWISPSCSMWNTCASKLQNDHVCDLFSSSACFLNTICRFLAVLSSLRKQISQVCSCFAWLDYYWGFFCSHYFSLVQCFFLNTGYCYCLIVHIYCPICVIDMNGTSYLASCSEECGIIFLSNWRIIIESGASPSKQHLSNALATVLALWWQVSDEQALKFAYIEWYTAALVNYIH